MSTEISFCCQELERHIKNPLPEDEVLIVPSIDADPDSGTVKAINWYIYDKEDRDTYSMDECVFCGTVLK